MELKPVQSQEELEKFWFKTTKQHLNGGKKSYHIQRNMQHFLEQQQSLMESSTFWDYNKEFGETLHRSNSQLVEQSKIATEKYQNGQISSSSDSDNSQDRISEKCLENIQQEQELAIQIQKNEQLKSELIGCENKYDDIIDLDKQKWQQKENKKGLTLHAMFNDETEEICSRVQTVMTLKNGESDFIEFIKKIENKPLYDPMFEKGDYVGDLGDDVTLQHWLLKGQAIVAQRHFTLLSKIKRDQARGVTYLIGKGIEMPEQEKKLKYSIKKAVRVLVNLAGWRLKHLGGDQYEVTYLQCSNPNGKLPYFIKKATPKFSYDMVKNVKKYMEKQQ